MASSRWMWMVVWWSSVVRGETDMAQFQADHLVPLTSVAQLPTLAIEDLVEVFTLRTEMVVGNMLEPLMVTMEHYALAFRRSSVDWETARRGEQVTSVHFLPRNSSALLGLPVFSGRNGSGSVGWPDASAHVMVTKHGSRFDFDLWEDADYIGTIGGLAFSRLVAQLPLYEATHDTYTAFEVYGAAPVNDDVFVQWCLERLAKEGATLTPLMRPERRALRLHARNSPSLVPNAKVDVFANAVRTCVFSKSAVQGSERWPLQVLAARSTAPLSACLRVGKG